MSVGIAGGVILGLIFLVTGFIKLPVQTDAYTILLVVRKESILLWLSDYVHVIVPWLEIILGFFLISGVAARLMALASTVLIVVFIYNNAWLIREGIDLRSCHCLGHALTRLLASFSAREALYIDLAMLGLIFLILAFYPDKWLSLRPWFLKNRPGR
jgi:uncharacterized membrane protein YphA (DoxX/SURF4 family)